MCKRILALCLVWVILVTCLPLNALRVYATPDSHPNTYVNTGNQRKDIIGVALTQVGYLEGQGNDTKYGVWYGANNLAWCGIFVAWCAEQAGVPKSIIPKTGVASPEAFGLSVKPSDYVPQSGDLFFAKDHSHVGLVYYVEGEYFYSLEGNTWENGPEGVYIRKKKISEFAYGSPAYQGGGDHSYVLGSEEAHPHKSFYRCSDCSDQYYTGSTVTSETCITCKQNSCAHSYSQWQADSNAQHSRECSLCAKRDTNSHSWNSGTVTQAATCNISGSKTQQCTDCGAEITTSIPQTGTHSYSPWEYRDMDTHLRTCSVCGSQEVLSHTAAEEWSTDEHAHWYNCPDCGQLTDSSSHTFGEECDSPCEVCGYARPDGHQFQEAWTTDDAAHWRVCEVCQTQKDFASHDFTADCDDTCDACGFTRATEHSFPSQWSMDESSHWFSCSVCGKTKDVQAHTPGEVSRQGAIQHCTVCQLVLTPESMHTHGYDRVYSDGDRHWGTCSCGLVMDSQNHVWSVKTETCSLCGAAMQLPEADYSDLLPWALGAGAFVVFGIVLVVVLLVRKNKA